MATPDTPQNTVPQGSSGYFANLAKLFQVPADGYTHGGQYALPDHIVNTIANTNSAAGSPNLAQTAQSQNQQTNAAAAQQLQAGQDFTKDITPLDLKNLKGKGGQPAPDANAAPTGTPAPDTSGSAPMPSTGGPTPPVSTSTPPDNGTMPKSATTIALSADDSPQATIDQAEKEYAQVKKHPAIDWMKRNMYANSPSEMETAGQQQSNYLEQTPTMQRIRRKQQIETAIGNGFSLDNLMTERATQKAQQLAYNDPDSNTSKVKVATTSEAIKSNKSIGDELKDTMLKLVQGKSAAQIDGMGVFASIKPVTDTITNNLANDTSMAGIADKNATAKSTLATAGKTQSETLPNSVNIEKVQSEINKNNAEAKKAAGGADLIPMNPATAAKHNANIQAADSALGWIERVKPIVDNYYTKNPSSNIVGGYIEKGKAKFGQSPELAQLTNAGNQLLQKLNAGEIKGNLSANRMKMIKDSMPQPEDGKPAWDAWLADVEDATNEAKQSSANALKGTKYENQGGNDAGASPTPVQTAPAAKTPSTSATRNVTLKDGRNVTINDKNEVVGSW